jgi:hypothetical protein
MILFDMSEISSLAIIAALGVLGYQFYAFERRYTKDKNKQAFESARTMDAVSEGRVLVDQLKKEATRLQREKILAQTVGDEAEHSERVARELKAVVKSADRSHAGILSVVNSVAELHKFLKPEQEDGAEIRSSASRKKGSMNGGNKKMESDCSNTNIVKFPIAK